MSLAVERGWMLPDRFRIPRVSDGRTLYLTPAETERCGWSSVALVERCAHLLPAGHEEAVRRFLAFDQSATTADPSP